MKKIKKIGTYSIIFFLFVIVWQLTSMVTFSIPPQLLEFTYGDIDNITGNWFYISVVVLQVGFGLMMLGSYLYKHYKKRNTAQSRQMDTKKDLLSTPS